MLSVEKKKKKKKEGTIPWNGEEKMTRQSRDKRDSKKRDGFFGVTAEAKGQRK